MPKRARSQVRRNRNRGDDDSASNQPTRLSLVGSSRLQCMCVCVCVCEVKHRNLHRLPLYPVDTMAPNAVDDVQVGKARHEIALSITERSHSSQRPKGRGVCPFPPEGRAAIPRRACHQSTFQSPGGCPRMVAGPTSAPGRPA